MKKYIIATGLIFLLSTPSFAGTMRGWIESIYPQINTPLIDTLVIYRDEGYVLIDVANDYAAYSYKAKRLTPEQRKNIGAVENDAGLVIRYESCSPQTGFLGGKIHLASVALKISDAADLAEEIREILEFTESKKFKAWGFGASKGKRDQSYMGWNDSIGNSVELQINKNTHQIKFQILKKCKNKK